MTYTDLLYGPIYAVLGAAVTLTLESATVLELIGLDKTAGAEITVADDASLQTIHPAAVVRMADLAELGVAPEDTMNARITINGQDWIVKSYYPKPSPRGEADGELYLILRAAT